MKRTDWADKAAKRMLERPWGLLPIARDLRAAERRGFKRAVKLVREKADDEHFCLWLEKRR